MSRPRTPDGLPASPGRENRWSLGQATRTRLARVVSILGHPVVAMALAAAVAGGEGGSPALRAQALVAVVVVAAVVMAYCAVKARSGAWEHIDASRGHERAQFNRFASWLLPGAAVVLGLAGAHIAIVATVALSGALVLASHLTRRWFKASLHVAFVVLATCVVWPDAVATAVGVVAAPAVAWSRLALSRHRPADIVAGAFLGLVAGIGLHAVVAG